MITSIPLFLTPVLQSLIATAIYESGKAGVSFLADKKSMEKRYRNAFEKAICRFYADPDYAGNEARRTYDDYLKALKENFAAEQDFDPKKGQYKKLLDLFKEEVCKDAKLHAWTMFKMLRTSVVKLEQIESEQRAILEQLARAREETKQDLNSINDKLDEIVKNLHASPVLKQVTVIPASLSVFPNADVNNLHIVKREALVLQCVEQCNEGKVLVLYGGVKTGKRTLAELILSSLNNGFICPDIPSGYLNDVIRICCQELKDGKKPIITTDAPIDGNMELVDMNRVAQVEVPLLTEDEIKELIETYVPRPDFSKFIWAHSYGHPVLARALCTYLTNCGWVVDTEVFGKMLNYSFDHQLSRSLADLMQRMIPDVDTRNLLNRLMLVKTTFTEDDVKALASLTPQIAEPRSRLLALTPGWVTEENGLYKVTPLYDKAWTPDMDDECYRACNWLLASRILNKKGSLNEVDVLHYILYSQNAGRYDESGLMYMRALGKIKKEDLPKLTILPSVWVDVPLPVQMTENVRIAIRVLQLTTLKDLSSGKRGFILNDLCGMVENAPESELTSVYYSMLSALCWAESRMQAGLKYYNLAISKKNDCNLGREEFGEMENLFKQSVWFLPLRFTQVEEFETWLDGFSTNPFEYDHSDPQICEHCYLSAYQLVNKVWEGKEAEEVLSGLQHILGKAEESKCPEMTVAILFELMETYNKARQYNNARKIYNDYYKRYEHYPLANVLLNGSMAYSIYLDKATDNQKALTYIGLMRSAGYVDVVPNIHLHLQQVEAYILCETDVNAGIGRMKEAMVYSQQSGHSSTPYEYYQCLGELSYMYWDAGDRVKATEAISECVKYVISEVGIVSPFAKTYLCLCDCLLVNYLDNLNLRMYSDCQAKPYRGMFTEQDAQSLDDLYSEDRIFTSSYLMCQICGALKMEKLKTEWAYRVLEAIKRRGEAKGIHFITTLLVPVFLKEQDFDAVAQIAEISTSSQSKTFEAYPEMKRENTDSEFIEYVMTPVLFLALRMAITGDKSGLNRIGDILRSYQPVVHDEVVNEVIAVLEREEYDQAYISEVKQLDMNRYYPVYIFAYLITALHVNSSQAFKYIMAVIVQLESDLVKVIGSEVKAVINDFIASFWRSRILTKPEDFANYPFLASKGMKLINEYEGKENQANHTMFVVRHHLLNEVSLNAIQEEWLDA